MPYEQEIRNALETGEAVSLAFKLVGLRRERYDIEETRKRLAEELADTVIAAYVCSKVCEVDLWETVDQKLDVEISRWSEFEVASR